MASLKVPSLPTKTHLNVTLAGKIRLQSGDGRVGVKLMLERQNGSWFLAEGCPEYVIAKRNEWTDFLIEDCIPMSFLEGNIKSVSVEVSPVPISQADYGVDSSASDVLVDDLKLTIKPTWNIDLTTQKM